MARILALILVMAACLGCLYGCSTALTKYPELGSDKNDTVVIGQFVDGYYLDQFAECEKVDSEGNFEFVCMDPSPMALALKVKSLIYGPNIRNGLTIVTTDHFGFQNYDFKNAHYFLLKVKSDGVNYIMPRYEKEPLARNVEGRYMTPVFPDEGISWLPCSLKALAVEVKPSDVPADFKTPIKDFDDFYLKEYPSEYVVSDGVVTPRHFIYVDEIAQALGNTVEKELSECGG
jgi:hypothetical protein